MATLGAQQVEPKDALLSLKVMRLAKPTFHATQPPLVEAHDYVAQSDVSCTPNVEQRGFGVRESLTLAASFGHIYVGETFRSYISVSNSSARDVADVTIKAELQTSQHRLILLDNSPRPISRFARAANHDFIVNQEVAEEGFYILICILSYARPDSGAREFFRKYYRFQVASPLAIAVRSTSLAHSVLVEAQIENKTHAPMFIEDVSLVPTPDWRVVNNNNNDNNNNNNNNNSSSSSSSSNTSTTPTTGGGVDDDSSDHATTTLADGAVSSSSTATLATTASTLGELRPLLDSLLRSLNRHLRPGSTTSVTFTLAAKDEARAARSLDLGLVECAWRSTMGDRGRFRTDTVRRKKATIGASSSSSSSSSSSLSASSADVYDLSVVLVGVPPRAVLERPLAVTAEVRNCSSTGRTFSGRLVLVRANMRGVVVGGASGTPIVGLAPGRSVSVPLSLLPLLPGVQRVAGVRLQSSIASDKPCDFNDLHELFVESATLEHRTTSNTNANANANANNHLPLAAHQSER